MCGWLTLQKACHMIQPELLQKCIKYSKICLDSFLRVTTALENLNLLQKSRPKHIQIIPHKFNKNIILVLDSVLNLKLNMQNT